MVDFIKGYFASLIDPKFLPTGVKVALVVGSILFAINHGTALVTGQMTRDRWMSGLLTYIVPYLVNVYGQYVSIYRQKA
jgi:hypothetical protein